MLHPPSRRSAAFAAILCTGVLLVLAPARSNAAHACAAAPSHPLIPYLIAPCAGATVPRHRAIAFTAHDADPKAAAHAPFLNLQTSRTIVDGHLAPSSDGNGIFAQMTPVAGAPGTWTFTAARERYASWWDNRPGVDYVQVDQVDPRAPSGVLYGPITAIHVAGAHH